MSTNKRYVFDVFGFYVVDIETVNPLANNAFEFYIIVDTGAL